MVACRYSGYTLDTRRVDIIISRKKDDNKILISFAYLFKIELNIPKTAQA